MAEIVPFRAVRYAATRGRALGDLLAPPCDPNDEPWRDELLHRSPRNVGHITACEGPPAAGPTPTMYGRARELWSSWLAGGELVRDAAPALYPLEQTFRASDGRPLRRRGLYAAVRLHELHEGVVIPRVRARAAQRADRLALLEAVKANLSPVFGLFHDDDGAAARALEALMGGEPAAETDSDDGVHHRLWRTTDPAAVSELRRLIAPARILVADGHDRYEAALEYRRILAGRDPSLPADGGHQWVLMYLCATNDPGLLVFATHRLVRGVEGFSPQAFLDGLSRWFTVETLEEDVRRAAGRAWAVSRLGDHVGKSTSFLVVTAADRKGRIVTLRDDVDHSAAGLPSEAPLAAMDVAVLHSLVFRHLLGLSPGIEGHGENVNYVRDAGEAVSRVLSGEHQVGFLLNPTPMWQVEAVAEAGLLAPRLSTFFRPRVQDGLVMREVDPRERP